MNEFAKIIAFIFVLISFCLMFLTTLIFPFLLLWGLIESSKDDQKKRDEALTELIVNKIRRNK